METISVIGLGKVGLALAACLADAGYEVIGAELDERIVDTVNRGEPQTAEPGVVERLGRGRVRATTDPMEAVAASTATFVIVPTPSNALGGFSLRYIKSACEQIGAALRRKDGYHLVCIVSTMLPGSSEHIVMPLLEEATGRKVGQTLGYCYNPAFIALGEVVKGFVEPAFVLIGESDREAGDRCLAIQERMVRNDAPIARMNTTEAEITKVASNTHETMRVSFANMLFSLCTELPGTNVDKITGALSYRMGRRFFKGAVPYGGPCWPRDNVALSVFMDTLRVPSLMPRAVDQFNAEHGKYVLYKVLEATSPGTSVGVVGLAYKPGTSVIERAYGIDLAGWLATEGRRVVAWDPLAMPSAKRALGCEVEFASSLEQCIAETGVVVIVNPVPELKDHDWSSAGDKIILDCWRCLATEQTALLRRYVPLGVGAAPGPDGAIGRGRLDVGQLRLLAE